MRSKNSHLYFEGLHRLLKEFALRIKIILKRLHHSYSLLIKFFQKLRVLNF